MCSPKAVLASGGGSRPGRVRCSTYEACEVAQDAARWTAHSAYTHSPRLPSFSHWLEVPELSPTRARLCKTTPDEAIASELAAYMHALHARLRCCHVSSRSLAVRCSVVICRPFDPLACARNPFHILAIAVYSSDLASCESARRIAGQITWHWHCQTRTLHPRPATESQSQISSCVATCSKSLGNLHACQRGHYIPVPFLSQSLVPNPLWLATRATHSRS